MKRFELKIKKPVKLALSFVLLFSLIGFAEREQEAALCKDIKIEVQNQKDNYFLGQGDILELMTGPGEGALAGRPLGTLDLKAIEKRLVSDKYVKEAQVFQDLSGNVVVKVGLRRPMARLIQQNGPDAYIAEDGHILPVSEKFTARVVLVGGDFVKQMIYEDDLSDKKFFPLIDLLGFIEKDKFWKAQVAQLMIDEKGEVTLYPQVTKQTVVFGKIEDIEEKFRKLKLFYQRILPQKGWNTYDRVNLKYKGQVLAE